MTLALAITINVLLDLALLAALAYVLTRPAKLRPVTVAVRPDGAREPLSAREPALTASARSARGRKRPARGPAQPQAALR